MKYRFKEPLRDELVLVRDPEEETQGGIVIPDTAKDGSQWGTVVLKGPKADQVKIGDRVLFQRYTTYVMDTPDGERLLTSQKACLAVEPVP